LIPGRSLDKFGLAAFYYALSSDLKDSIRPVVNLGDEYGMELFYNYAVTPWFRLTGDVQVIQPTLQNRGTAVFLNLRAQVRL